MVELYTKILYLYEFYAAFFLTRDEPFGEKLGFRCFKNDGNRSFYTENLNLMIFLIVSFLLVKIYELRYHLLVFF